jgi:hypothetical protein
MDPHYMLTCGIIWRNIADPEAGWELVEALESPDPRLRLLAQSLLIDNGEASMDLLEGAVASGILSPEAAGPCMAEILRSGQARLTRKPVIRRHLGDVLLC